MRISDWSSDVCSSDLDGKVTAVHDVSDGGLLVAVAEMALASGIGATLEQIGDHATAFGEDQGRYVVTSRNPETIQAAGFPMTRIGTTGGASVRGAGPDDSHERTEEHRAWQARVGQGRYLRWAYMKKKKNNK